MRRTLVPALALCALLTIPAVSQAAPPWANVESQSATAPLLAAIRDACLSAAPAVRPGVAASCDASRIDRRELPGGVAEYSLKLRVGPGEHDVIGLHRVVQERSAGVPKRAAKAVMMAHGDAWNFDAAFLSAAIAPTPSAHAFPIYLAQHGIDVWGIDFRWTQVPATTTDLSFMAGWGMAKDRDDLGIALVAARAIRLATGSGAGRIDLLGWSRGALLGYAYLSAESQLPAILRNVKGFVPVDILMKTDDDGVRQAACNRYAAEAAELAAGTYASTTGTLFGTIGTLALTAPSGASPIIPGFTNEQAGVFAGSATYQLLPPDQVFVPFYHFAGGSFGPGGVPTGLVYTPDATFFQFESGGAAVPFEPVKLLADGDATICGAPAVPFDDHLGQITVPVLYVGAGGGFGTYGLYTTTLLGSSDLTTHVVSLTPTDRAADIGHADIWLADDAQSLFWQPILSWIQGH